MKIISFILFMASFLMVCLPSNTYAQSANPLRGDWGGWTIEANAEKAKKEAEAKERAAKGDAAAAKADAVGKIKIQNRLNNLMDGHEEQQHNINRTNPYKMNYEQRQRLGGDYSRARMSSQNFHEYLGKEQTKMSNLLNNVKSKDTNVDYKDNSQDFLIANSEDSSSKLNFTDTDWRFIKSTKKLEYETIDEFAEGTIQQSSSIQDKILDLANMPLQTFKNNLNKCANEIEEWYNINADNLSKELENAEKLHDIANFMLQYKGYLATTYIHGMSDNPAAADDAARKAFGKTRDELAYENIEKMEKELFEKYGMIGEDIAKLKKIIDEENKVQNYVEKARGLKIDKTMDPALGMTVEKLDKIASKKSIELFGKDYNTIGGTTGKVADQSITFDRVIDMGVLLNNDIALLGLSKNEKALANYVESIKNQQILIKDVRNKETQKIGDLMTIIDNNSQGMKDYVSKMSQRDKLHWADETDKIIERIHSRGAKNLYEVFPDRFSNLYIKEGTTLESHFTNINR